MATEKLNSLNKQALAMNNKHQENGHMKSKSQQTKSWGNYEYTPPWQVYENQSKRYCV